MNKCLNCSKPCGASVVFCDECRASLLKRQPTPASAPKQRVSRPIRTRVALIALVLTGTISLVAVAILLTTNALRHHNMPPTSMAVVPFSQKAGQTGAAGKTHTPTPAISASGSSPTTPVAGQTPTPAITSTITPTMPPPCVLQAMPAHLSFQATLLQNPPGQSITLKTTGDCGQSVTWNATVDTSWVQLSSSSGSVNGAGTSFTVNINTNGLLLGTYKAHIILTAVDSDGVMVTGSPQTISVTLTVIA